MALEYSFKIALKKTENLEEMLARTPGIEEMVIEGKRIFTSTGIVSMVVHSTSEGMQKTCEEAYDFTPTHDLYIRLDKNFENGFSNVLSVLIPLLQVSTSDCVLLFNFETPFFLRKNGKLLLTSRGEIWSEEFPYIQMMTLPYEFATLISL